MVAPLLTSRANYRAEDHCSEARSETTIERSMKATTARCIKIDYFRT